jgi:hypothetical protein
MLWSDVDESAIRVVQRKTGAKLSIPIHCDLAAALAAWPRRNATILTTSFGKAFTSNGFGNFMADKIADAGLPERCVTHGLRKAAARRLAEAGCSANEIMAITGHATLTEVTRYTKAAEQRRLAHKAIQRLTSSSSVSGFPNLSDQFGNFRRKSWNFNVDLGEWRTGEDSNFDECAHITSDLVTWAPVSMLGARPPWL